LSNDGEQVRHTDEGNLTHICMAGKSFFSSLAAVQ